MPHNLQKKAEMTRRRATERADGVRGKTPNTARAAGYCPPLDDGLRMLATRYTRGPLAAGDHVRAA